MLFSQTQTTGRIAGTVKDAQGAVIAGAEVIIESSSVQWSQTMRGTRSYHCHVPKGLKRFYGNGDLHFVTASCYHRDPLLGTPCRRDLFLKVLELVRQRYEFVGSGIRGHAGA